MNTEPEDLLKEWGGGNSGVDLLIGGPPCQAYARVGRAKLREIAAHPKAFLRDPRSNLYLRYLHYVEKLKPLAVLIENVPDALNHGGHNVAEETCEALSDLGYEAAYTLLNSAYYGVPQTRERMFLIAYAKASRIAPSFPAATHWAPLPRGYEGTRSVALRTIDQSSLFQMSYYTPPPEATHDLMPAVTAEEATSDLPAITAHLDGKLRKGPRYFDTLLPYRDDIAPSEYAGLMRSWPGFSGGEGVYDHVIRYLPRDYAIFKRMLPGDQYPEAHALAMKMFDEELQRRRRRGQAVKPGSGAYTDLMRKIVPPYDPGKFPNKWRKMERDKPARTLMAHLGKDSYSHIHYDSDQARTISVREAARLQSFPDGFVVEGPMNPGFRQIGNAVPPLLATALAVHMLSELRGEARYGENERQAADGIRSNVL